MSPAILTIDSSSISPELIWLFAVVMLFILAYFGAAAFALHGLIQKEPLRTDPVPPIPQCSGYDSKISPFTRMEELKWMAELMDAPAYGEDTAVDEETELQ